MAIDMIEDNELSALSVNRQQGFVGDIHNKFGIGCFSDNKYSNFLGINLRGKAYSSEEDEVAGYEKDVTAGKWKKAFSLTAPQSSCAAVDSMLDQIDTELANLNRKAQSAKPAFRARWEKLTDQLRTHRANFDNANAKLNCADVRKAQAQADNQQYLNQLMGVVKTATEASQSKSNLTPYIVLGTVGIAGVGVMIYFILKSKKPAQ